MRRPLSRTIAGDFVAMTKTGIQTTTAMTIPTRALSSTAMSAATTTATSPVPSTMKTTATTPMTSTTIIATIPPALSEMELQIETLSQAGNIRERSRLLANTLSASTLTYENFSLIYRTTSVCYGLLRGRVYMTIVIDSRLRDQRPIE
ncbi:hypothetical protein MPH_01998 [Macrophomina phaseolina MS6]|uniref:Uncharacterized protein n=1 Tax=Macrophomina phaseolina (strain MS6) TaxID=1126212 RepID=K2S0Z2_MACPH|nr:hypothetical protein MPH_01998 [Macrophomina phaseolina MS6]